MDTDITGLPAHVQLNILTAIVGVKLIGQLYSAVRNGGGLKRIITAFWLGENLPKCVAADYKSELSKPPFPKVDGEAGSQEVVK